MNINFIYLYLIFIAIDEVKVTSWIDFELGCVPSVGVLLTLGIGFQYECHNTYFHCGKPILLHVIYLYIYWIKNTTMQSYVHE